MRTSGFARALPGPDDFLVTVELLTSPTDGVDSYHDFFDAFRAYAHREGWPRIVAVTSPHSPGGVPTMDPFTVWSRTQEALPEGLAAIAHVTCKDLNRNGLETHLRNLRSVGVGTILALTGDFPQDSKPVFELDSLGLLRLIMELNGQTLARTSPDELDNAFQFDVGAGVNPFKYSLASAWQQYAKMAKKVLSGATFLLTQVGYDAVKSEELVRYVRAHDLDVPVFGNVYLLTKRAAERMHGGELPGCYASDALMERVSAEWRTAAKGHAAALERMAYQTALFRHLGYRGVHMGGWGLTFEDVVEVIGRAQKMSGGAFDEEKALDVCHFPAPEPHYFIGKDGEFALPDKPPRRETFVQKRLRFLHEHATSPRSVVGKTIHRLTQGDAERTGAAARTVYAVERAAKAFFVQCRDCGDCYLPENYHALCNEAACVKGLPNTPCGDSDALTGHCGNAEDTICAGELVFYAAFARGKLGNLSRRINASKIPELRGTSAVLNYLAGLDHRGRIAGQLRREKSVPLVVIGEMIHAQIPRVHWAMQRVLENPEKRMTGALAYLADLITSQAIAGADYIDINVDAFPDAVRPRMMRYYVDLVNSLSKGVPVCVDSSDPATKAAGIDQYFKTARNPEALPVLNSIRPVHPKHVLELRERYPFRVVAMLHERVDENGSPAAVESVEEVHALARDMFRVLTGSGFEPGDIFFDTAVCPIAADIEAKRTYLTMHGIRAIMSDPQMSGVHTVIGLTNASHMMPNRLSLNRSYLRVAMEYGLTAAVLDPRVNYGERDPGRQSLDIIQRLAENDGSDLAASMEIFEAIAEYSRRYGSRRRRGGEDG